MVIGGGVAGCVVASILSDDPSNDVVLLESGPDHGGSVDAVRDRGPLLDCPARSRADAVVTRRRGQPAVTYPQGSGLGGSSLINGGVVTGAGPAGRLPLEAPTGVGGLGRAVLAAEPDARLVRLVRRGGERVSAADVYIAPVRSRPNLTVETGTNAIRLV
ncbi:MAG: NAD(P)-binding protein, partial [Ilumatobacteraceae bacterium]